MELLKDRLEAAEIELSLADKANAILRGDIESMRKGRDAALAQVAALTKAMFFNDGRCRECGVAENHGRYCWVGIVLAHQPAPEGASEESDDG